MRGISMRYCPYCRHQTLSKRYLWDAKTNWSNKANCMITRESWIIVCQVCAKQHIESEARPQIAIKDK